MLVNTDGHTELWWGYKWLRQALGSHTLQDLRFHLLGRVLDMFFRCIPQLSVSVCHSWSDCKILSCAFLSFFFFFIFPLFSFLFFPSEIHQVQNVMEELFCLHRRYGTVFGNPCLLYCSRTLTQWSGAMVETLLPPWLPFSWSLLLGWAQKELEAWCEMRMFACGELDLSPLFIHVGFGGPACGGGGWRLMIHEVPSNLRHSVILIY